MALQAEGKAKSLSLEGPAFLLRSSRCRSSLQFRCPRKSLSDEEETAGIYLPPRSKKSSRREFLSRCKRFRSLFRAAVLQLSKGTTWIYFDNRNTPRRVQWYPVRYRRNRRSYRSGNTLVFRGCDRKVTKCLCIFCFSTQQSTCTILTKFNLLVLLRTYKKYLIE